MECHVRRRENALAHGLSDKFSFAVGAIACELKNPDAIDTEILADFPRRHLENVV